MSPQALSILVHWEYGRESASIIDCVRKIKSYATVHFDTIYDIDVAIKVGDLLDRVIVTGGIATCEEQLTQNSIHFSKLITELRSLAGYLSPRRANLFLDPDFPNKEPPVRVMESGVSLIWSAENVPSLQFKPLIAGRRLEVPSPERRARFTVSWVNQIRDRIDFADGMVLGRSFKTDEPLIDLGCYDSAGMLMPDTLFMRGVAVFLSSKYPYQEAQRQMIPEVLAAAMHAADHGKWEGPNIYAAQAQAQMQSRFVHVASQHLNCENSEAFKGGLVIFFPGHVLNSQEIVRTAEQFGKGWMQHPKFDMWPIGGTLSEDLRILINSKTKLKAAMAALWGYRMKQELTPSSLHAFQKELAKREKMGNEVATLYLNGEDYHTRSMEMKKLFMKLFPKISKTDPRWRNTKKGGIRKFDGDLPQ